MRKVLNVSLVGLALALISEIAPTKTKADTAIDGFVSAGRSQAVGATVQIYNTATGRLAWQGTANGYNPSFPGQRNYFKSARLAPGRYTVWAFYGKRSGQTCCARLDGSTYPKYYSRQNVNVN